MRVLLTGASSFTGYAFAKALAAAGHEIVAPTRMSKEEYRGLRADRLALLDEIADIRWSCTFGTEQFLKLVSGARIDVLCHHASEVSNYRSADFDVIAALSSNTFGVRGVLNSLVRNGLKHVILTGSVFEADTGGGSRHLNAFSPYGLSKTLTAQIFRYWCFVENVPLSRFVIANPFGPFEEPRFCTYLTQTWKNNQVAIVNTPDYIRDNIPVDLLASCYARFCDDALSAGAALERGPSCYIESQGMFARRMAHELAPRLKLPCEVNFAVQTDRTEPMVRINLDRAQDLVPAWDEARFWDGYANYILGHR